MYNLGTVFGFEVIRTLKKKSFWLLSLLFPVMIGVVVAIIFFSSKVTDEAADTARNEQFTIAVTDKSETIDKNLLAGFQAKTYNTKAEGIAAVKNGTVEAYYFYPDNLVNQRVEVYGNDVGLFDNGRYEDVAKLLLNQSISGEVAAGQAAILKDSVRFASTNYRDGEAYNGILQAIVPGIFLVLFYLLIATFGSQMLTSTTEEKENRVIEMILTTVRAKTLIVGKILSLVVLGFIQSAIVMVPIVISYFVFRDSLPFPVFDLASIPFDWTRIVIGAVLFSLSFLLFTGLLVTIGAATPTAKEAGGFFGVIMMLIFGPLYAAPLFISSPESTVVQVLSYFPFTSPIPLLLRNAVGTLELWQAGIAAIILLATTLIILRIAVRVFRFGALEYSRKLSIREVLARG